MAQIVMQVKGMSCNHCVNSVEGALREIAGVDTAKVSLADNNVTVAYNDQLVTMGQLKEAVEEQGYDVV